MHSRCIAPSVVYGGDPRRPAPLQELEAHAFFQQPNFTFDKVYKKEITPIYKPNIGGETDTANFDPQFTAEVGDATCLASAQTTGSGRLSDRLPY